MGTSINYNYHGIFNAHLTCILPLRFVLFERILTFNVLLFLFVANSASNHYFMCIQVFIEFKFSIWIIKLYFDFKSNDQIFTGSHSNIGLFFKKKIQNHTLHFDRS